jgi:hypothetical protein
MVYDFAYDVLFNNYLNYIDAPTRDIVFKLSLKSFKEKPVKIFQIGAIETFNINWRVGSGWSDLIFGEYIKKYGGKLSICDINLDNIAHSYMASKQLGYDINICYGDAINFIDEQDYDIYYLDGGNDPKETLDQFNKIKNKKALIIVDDFKIKGTLLDDSFYVVDIANQIGLLDLRN